MAFFLFFGVFGCSLPFYGEFGAVLDLLRGWCQCGGYGASLDWGVMEFPQKEEAFWGVTFLLYWRGNRGREAEAVLEVWV